MATALREGRIPISTGTHLVSPDRLREFVREVFQRLGCPADALPCVEDYLVQVSLFGIDTHGLMQIPRYVRDVRRGKIDASASMEVVRDSAVVAVIDGNNGLGMVTATRAMEIALEKCESHGVGVVAVRGGNHFGAAGYYAHMAIARDRIGVVLTNGPGQHMAPWGSLTPLISNNPIAIGVPGGEESPLLLDVSFSVAARGKITSAVSDGITAIPAGWATDAEGRPTTDPGVALKGLLVPVGEHKGSGLSVALGMLCACLGGAAFDSEIDIDSPEPRNTGHMMVALNAKAFSDVEDFKARADVRLRELRQARPSTESGVWLPGDRAYRTARKRQREGIPVGPGLLGELNEIRSQLSVSAVLE